MGQITDLSLRGGTTGSTLLLKNGARLNTQNSFGPVLPELIDLTDVDQIEILKVQHLFSMDQMQLVG